MRLAKWGRREILYGLMAADMAVVLIILLAVWMGARGCLLLPLPLALFGWELWFFRDPVRVPPEGEGLLLAPADGTVTHIDEVRDPSVFGGEPAIRYSMFLSIFNVHLNRAPVAGEVTMAQHRPGGFLDARRGDSADVNERNDILLDTGDARCPRVVVRQIAGKIARRIVCEAKPGDRLARGEVYGMIKFGSRTTLFFPAGTRLAWRVKVGDAVKAGETVLAVLEAEGL
jgi:phosphatidylserine decarboxylase